MAVAAGYLPGIADAAIEDVVIGWRPLPLDGLPVMGFSPAQPGVYLAIAHSGVTLAPILGQLAAQEILDGTRAEALSPYRPDRKFVDGGRY
jgi:glycine/D-amino acid oxidase-like deaminating enzyme